MTMNRLVQTALTAALLLVAAPSAVHAEPLDPPDSITFETVDSVQFHDNRSLIVKGIPVGQSQPQEYSFYFYASNEAAAECHKQALIAMDRPGRYRLELTSPDEGYACRLIRR
jgi:hypothetical protein